MLSKLKILDFVLNKGDNEATVGYVASVIEWPISEAFFVIKSIKGALINTIQTTQITGNAFGVEELELASKIPKKQQVLKNWMQMMSILRMTFLHYLKKITKVKQALIRSVSNIFNIYNNK